MTDFLHEHAPSTPSPESSSDEKIEQLLLSGLDHYFASRYEQAISAWSRVLFLDRAHSRARAYIDRARRAIAERQRESEELLHAGLTAFDKGDTIAARQLLTASVERGGLQEVALTLLERLDRLDAGSVPASRPRQRDRVRTADQKRWRGVRRVALATVVLLAIGGGVWTMGRRWPQLQSLWVLPPTPNPSAAGSYDAQIPVPRASEIAFERARTLYSRGHLRQALELLETIDLADSNREEAERLRGEIQRILLRGPEFRPEKKDEETRPINGSVGRDGRTQ